MVIVREDGVERRMTAAEAFLLHITRRGLDGDGAAARAAMTAIAEARSRRPRTDQPGPTQIVIVPVSPGSVNLALVPLRMAAKLDRLRPTARMALEPWLVEMGLELLGERRLTPAEQQTVWKATRTPWKVEWPEWWEWKG